MKITYQCEVRGDRLHVFNRKAFDKELQGLSGRKLELTLRTKRNARTLAQNAYYFGVVIPVVRQGMLDVGYKMSIDDTHNFLKSRFHIVEHLNEKTGEIIKSIGSTTNMTTTSMMDYFAEITQWAAEYLDVQIPEPNEQVSMDLD